ncbi:serine palmitoyltransferase component [Nowakowskiella sp. JEL0407]|nr:serine palmitoyltransferase component [Nowakowskiella sp. JEL0407]
MGKGKRAHFDKTKHSIPVSSSDVLNPVPLLDGPPPLYTYDALVNEKRRKAQDEEHLVEDAPLPVLVTTYLSYLVLIIFGHLRDFFGMRFKRDGYSHLKNSNVSEDQFMIYHYLIVSYQGYAPLNSGFDTFYTRRLYRRISDVFNRPITGVPGRIVKCLERTSADFNKTFKLTGRTIECLNLSSYNYLGFAQADGPCADAVEVGIRKYGVSSGSARSQGAQSELHVETENLIARFLGQEAAIIVSMGFSTNSTNIPALMGKGSLIISDELNHSSIVYGTRVSGATVKTFKHNDPASLEKVLRENIALGQPRTHRPWKKIMVIVEGLYSMEGTIVCLPEIIALKRKYKFYLYLDEAHSIGAMGPNGRGVCDYYGIDPSQVDVLMGTFTKSFGAAGGYIAGRKSLIDHLRLYSHASVYAEAITPPVLQQIYTSTKIIMGEDGTDDGHRRIQALARNARYFSTKLKEMGFIVYGAEDSPVVPMLLFHPCKIPAFSREMLQRNVAVVVVGYPATPIITSRVRFCLSAAHSIEDLDRVLEAISEVGDRLVLKVSQRKHHQTHKRITA